MREKLFFFSSLHHSIIRVSFCLGVVFLKHKGTSTHLSAKTIFQPCEGFSLATCLDHHWRQDIWISLVCYNRTWCVRILTSRNIVLLDFGIHQEVYLKNLWLKACNLIMFVYSTSSSKWGFQIICLIFAAYYLCFWSLYVLVWTCLKSNIGIKSHACLVFQSCMFWLLLYEALNCIFCLTLHFSVWVKNYF